MFTYKFIHYGIVPNLTELNPAYYNSNEMIKSGEAVRVYEYNAPLRIYAYTNLKHRRETSLGLHKYTGTIDNIYDINKDELELKKRLDHTNSDERFTQLEKLIFSNGYNGYYVDNYETIAIFVCVNVKEVK